MYCSINVFVPLKQLDTASYYTKTSSPLKYSYVIVLLLHSANILTDEEGK